MGGLLDLRALVERELADRDERGEDDPRITERIDLRLAMAEEDLAAARAALASDEPQVSHADILAELTD